MKNSFNQIPRLLCLLAIAVFFQLNSNAKVITVSNGVVAGGAYSNLQTAINAANPGDTVYAMGSVNSYGAITIKTQITLMGAGYNPLGTQQQLPSIIDAISLVSVSATATGATGTKIIGIYSPNSSWSGSDTNVKNVTISRCLFSTVYVTGNGWIIKNCICQNLYFYYNPVKTCFVANCFITGTLRDLTGGFDNGLIVDHSIFESATYNIMYANFTNNIFFTANQSAGTTNKYNTYDNNITYSTTIKDSLVQGTNGGSKNIYNPVYTKFFVSQQTTSTGWNSANIYAVDWHLVSSCLGHNAATDATDIGIYGGAYPMNFTGASILPQITYMNINNAIIAPGSKLGVTFKARIQK